MNRTHFLLAGWAVTAIALVVALSRGDERGSAAEPADAIARSPADPEDGRTDGSLRAQQPIAPDRRAVGQPEPAEPEDPTQSENYQRALARALLPEPTGDVDRDRRNGLRHRVHHCGLYDDVSFAGPAWDPMTAEKDPRINPEGIDLTDEQRQEVGRLLGGDVQERKRLWQHRLRLEGEAMLVAIDAGSFDWFGPTARHQDPNLSAPEQQIAFQRRMTEAWGPMGKGWTCMMTDVRGEPMVVFVTPRSAPALFAAIEGCVANEAAELEAARRYVESIPR